MLIVDDDPDIGLALRDYFEMNGYDVTVATDGVEALDLMRETPGYDIVLLDVMLPHKNGFEVLKESQEYGITSPILMLTARGEQENILKGFGLGADDYITKPFNAEELAARVKAILQRTQPPSSKPMDVYEIGDVEINFSTHEATREGEEVNFTALEFDILRYLIENREQTVSRRQLLKDVWGIEQEIITRTIDRHMASIRKKIEDDPSNPDHIETVYGIGYRFNP
ncbi:MAG: response regulator [Bacteroidetes bacterium]|jgi:DNA-binding response OmpR family regulator|nr:response regulator [Bacteroidota bacterium]